MELNICVKTKTKAKKIPELKINVKKTANRQKQSNSTKNIIESHGQNYGKLLAIFSIINFAKTLIWKVCRYFHACLSDIFIT